MHIEKLRSLSSTARIAREECKPVEVKELPAVVVYPEDISSMSGTQFKSQAVSTETLGKLDLSVF